MITSYAVKKQKIPQKKILRDDLHKINHGTTRIAQNFDIKIDDQFNLKDTTNVFYKNLTWQSSNNEIATVNDKGQVFAHNKGQVNITCTNAYGESDVCQLNIFYFWLLFFLCNKYPNLQLFVHNRLHANFCTTWVNWQCAL